MAVSIVLLSVLHSPPAASAGDSSDNTLHATFGAAVMDFNYKEFNAGETLNREEGGLSGVTMSVQRGWRAGFLEARAAWLGGEVDYRGQTQNGVPASTTTEESITNGSALYGQYVYQGQTLRHALIAGLGFRDWRRDINSTDSAFGVFERYSWWYGQLGWRIHLRSTARSSWMLQAKLLRPFAGKIDIEFDSDFDDASLSLGAKNGLQLNLAYVFRVAQNWRFTLEGEYTAWHIDRSNTGSLRQNGVDVGEIFEPASDTRGFGLQFSGTYAF